MKAAVWYGKNDVRIEERGNPSLRSGEARVKVLATGICGTDLMVYEGRFPRARPPLVPGHEFVGEVVATKDTPKNLKTGDRVAVYPLISCGRCVSCRMGFPHVCETLKVMGVDADGSFAEYVSVPWTKLFKIAGDSSYETCALIEPTAVACHMISRAHLRIGDRVVILGAGPIGLLTAMMARHAGASTIILTEVLKDRLRFAEDLGFEALDSLSHNIVREVRAKTGTGGVDIVFDAAGVPQAADIMVSLVRPRGRIVLAGLHKQAPAVDLFNTSIKEAELVGSRVYSEIDFERAVDLIVSGRLEVVSLITHRLPLAEVEEGFRIIREGKHVMKVVLSE